MLDDYDMRRFDEQAAEEEEDREYDRQRNVVHVSPEFRRMAAAWVQAQWYPRDAAVRAEHVAATEAFKKGSHTHG